MMKKIECVTSSLILIGLFLPMFWSREQTVGVLTLPDCLDRCPEPGGISAIVLFLIGWFVLSGCFICCQFRAIRKRDDSRILVQMWFWCMLLLFFRIQNSETFYFGTTHPFLGWWCIILGIGIKLALRMDWQDKEARRGLVRLILLSLIILAASAPFMTCEVIPDYEREQNAVSAGVSIGGIFFSDLFRTKENGTYLVASLRAWQAVLLTAVCLFVSLQILLKKLFSKICTKSGFCA